MIKESLTHIQATEIADKLKKAYKFGKSSCPKWFSNTSIGMRQNSTYFVEICIPSWASISQEEQNVFLEPFEGTHISLRVVVPAVKIDFNKKV